MRKSRVSLFPSPIRQLRFYASGNTRCRSAANNSAVATLLALLASTGEEARVARHPSPSPRTVRIILIQELTQRILSRRNGALRRGGAQHPAGAGASAAVVDDHANVDDHQIARLRTHARETRRDTAACDVRLFPFDGNVTPAAPFRSCGPVAPIQESPADCELAPCRDMGVVEAWETRDRGGCSTAFGKWERTTVSTGG